MNNKLDGATVTEAHRKLAADLCRHATGSNRALHHVPKFAQLIADSEAQACDQLRAEVATLREIARDENCPHKYYPDGGVIYGVHGTSSISYVEKLRAELEDLKAAGGPPFIRSKAIQNLREDVARLKNLLLQADELNEGALFKISETMKRAERAEAELEEARKDSKRYRYIAWKSDTNPIMIIKLNDNILLHGYDANEAIDAAMKEETK